jgi:dTDP-glucose 4,6-dehydratase
MKFLITGSARFLGSAVIRHLMDDSMHRVLNLDKLTYASDLESLSSVDSSDRYQFFQADICDSDFLKTIFIGFQPNVVISLAAESDVDRSIDDPAEFIQTNFVCAYQLLDDSRAYWKSLSGDKQSQLRFHHMSTDEVSGDLEGMDDFVQDNHSRLSMEKLDKCIGLSPCFWEIELLRTHVS